MEAVSVDAHRGAGKPMEAPASARVGDGCAYVRAPRRANARHRWGALVVMALGAVRSGAQGWEDMAEEGPAHAAWCQACLARPQGMPAPAPWRRGLARLTPDARPPGVGRWSAALRAARDGASSARDGNTRRRSWAPAAAQGALPMVSAGAQAHRRV